jgi:prepilin-type N-terminal cleavage/methylation domain-containing protein
MDIKRLQAGFTAVELLITLFIAAIFLFAGYQLYTQVMKDGAAAEKTARLSSLVYERLHKETAGIATANSSQCTATTLAGYPVTETPTLAGFSNLSLTIAVECPLNASTNSDLFKVTVTASYNDGTPTTKALSHATYVN